jgi:hypothetical protein
MDFATLSGKMGRYDNPIPSRFLALLDCTKIPAQMMSGQVILDVRQILSTKFLHVPRNDWSSPTRSKRQVLFNICLSPTMSGQVKLNVWSSPTQQLFSTQHLVKF